MKEKTLDRGRKIPIAMLACGLALAQWASLQPHQHEAAAGVFTMR